MTTNQAHVHEVADEFSRLIRDWIRPEAMDDVVRRNRQSDVSPCATRKYCEASIAMAGAFTLVCGRVPDLRSPADAKLWSDAWTMARRSRFPRRIYQVENDKGQPVYGLQIKGRWIADPRLSECARFKVDPVEYYGLQPEEIFTFDVARSSAPAKYLPTLETQRLTVAKEPVSTIWRICEQYPALSGVYHGHSFALSHPCEGGGYILITACDKSCMNGAQPAVVGIERCAPNDAQIEPRTTIPIESLEEWIDQALSRANNPTNVGDYFLKRLGRQHRNDSLFTLPLASPCGEACVSAIEAAHKLVEEIRAAVGESWEDINSVVDVAQKVVAVYWRG